MPNKYSEQDLQELLMEVRISGWASLTKGERIAVGRYCRKTGLLIPDTAGLADAEARDVERHKTKHVYESIKPENTTKQPAQHVPVKVETTISTPAPNKPATLTVTAKPTVPTLEQVKAAHPSAQPSTSIYDDNGEIIGHIITNVQKELPKLNPLQQKYQAIARAAQQHPNQWIELAREFNTRKQAASFATRVRCAKTATWKTSTGHYNALPQSHDDKHYVAIRYTTDAKE